MLEEKISSVSLLFKVSDVGMRILQILPLSVFVPCAPTVPTSAPHLSCCPPHYS